MRSGDPVDFQPRQLGKWIAGDDKVRGLDIIIAYEEDLNAIMAFERAEDIAGLMRYLERGRNHEAGDCTPVVPLRKI